MLHGSNMIGARRSAEGERLLHAVDPRTSHPLKPAFAEATASEVDLSLRLAEQAFAELGSIDDARRAAFLEAIASKLRASSEIIVDRAMAETGLGEGRLLGELTRTTNQLEMFARLVLEGSWVDARIDVGDPARVPAPKPDVRRMLVGLGPVVVFGASNFPLAFSVAGGDTASAIAAGCSVVVKGHPAHPGTSELVGEVVLTAAREQGMPDGIFSLLHGAGHDVGTALLMHPNTRAVGFTGSTAGGMALFRAAAQRDVPIPVFAEMGSINPVFVLPGPLRTRPKEIAAGLHASFTLGVGQFCTNPGVTVVADVEGRNAFEGALASLVAATEPGVMLHQGIREAFDRGVEGAISTPGVVVLKRGAPVDAGGAYGSAVALAVDADSFLAHSNLAEEVFGPSTLLVRAKSGSDMVDIANHLGGHLTATIIADPEDLDDYQELVSTLAGKVGRLIVNGYPTGVEVGPAMHHGGPYPATTDPRFTSVGTAAIYRFARPIAYQDFPEGLLPAQLQRTNPRGIERLVDGKRTREGA